MLCAAGHSRLAVVNYFIDPIFVHVDVIHTVIDVSGHILIVQYIVGDCFGLVE